MKLLVTLPWPQEAVDWLQSAMPPGVRCELLPSPSEEDWARSAADADILLGAHFLIDAHRLDMAPRVRFILQPGTGYDKIDVAAVAARGIAAAYLPGINASNVAEYTVMLMLAWLKRFVMVEHAARTGQVAALQSKLAQSGAGDLATSTVGLVGLGRIGQGVAARLAPFGSRILYHTRRRVDASLEARLGVTYSTLPDLLAACNIVSLHVPLTAETRHLIGAAELAMMPRGALLVNVSRGGVVDEAALRQAIEGGRLGGAALDVLEDETVGANPFADLPQVIVTPHVASFSDGLAALTMRRVADDVARFMAGEPVLDPIPGTEGARAK